MVASIQAVSDRGGVAALSPVQVWSGISRVAQAQIASEASPSAVTALGTTADTAAFTYEAIVLLQTFSPSSILNSGLSAAQQRELAVALGLSPNATSTELMDAINALLIPTDTSQALVNVLLGDTTAATEEAAPLIPDFLNDEGDIIGIPGDSESQARDAVLATLLELGATGAVASTAVPLTDSAGDVTEDQQAAAATVAENVPTESLIPAATEQVAATVNTAAAATVAVVAEAAPAAELVPAAIVAPTAETVAATVIEETAVTPAAVPVTTIAVTAAEVAAVPVTEAEVVATAVPVVVTTPLPAIEIAEVTAAARASQGVVEAGQPALILPVAETEVTVAPTAAVALPAFAGLEAAAEVAAPATVAPAVVSAAPATTLPEIQFDNAGSVLQSLLAEASAHALMVQRNPASATYGVGGALLQMGTGADHAQPALKGNLPDTRDVTSPVSRIAATRGTIERQT